MAAEAERLGVRPSPVTGRAAGDPRLEAGRSRARWHRTTHRRRAHDRGGRPTALAGVDDGAVRRPRPLALVAGVLTVGGQAFAKAALILGAGQRRPATLAGIAVTQRLS